MNIQNQPTILVVNDSEDQLDLLKFILRQAEYKVLTASGGNEGFEIVRRMNPDLIVSDVIMPDGDGIELCRRLRADEKFRSLPVLFLSALRKGADNATEGLQVGADDYLESPFDPVNLVARVARLIERKRTDDVLRENERYFRSLIDNVSDIISILSNEGVIYYESPSVEQILGYQPKFLRGKSVFDFIHPDDKSKVTDYFRSVVTPQIGVSQPVEFRFRHKNGSWRVIESVGKVIEDPERGSVAVINSRDITEQVKAETALRESENKFRTVLENSRDIIYQFNLQAKIFDYMSPAARDISGYDAEEFIKGGFVFGNSLVHPEDLPLLKKHVAAFADSNENLDNRMEYRLLTKEGGYRWVDENRTVLRDANGKSISIIAVARDITAQKRDAATLQFQKTLLEAQSDASIEGILVVSSEGEIVSYNRRFAEMWKISSALDAESDEMPLKTVLDSVENPKEFLDTLYRFYEHSDEIDQSEVRLRDGRVFERYTSPVKDAGGIHYGRVWFFRDITEPRKIAEALAGSEDRYRDLVENSRDLICTHDLEGRILSINRTAVNALGYDRETLLDKNIENLLASRFGGEFGYYLERIKKDGYASGVMKVKTRGGETRVWKYANTLRTEGVDTPIVRGMATDITELLKAENTLRQSEANLAAAQRITHLGSWEVELDDLRRVNNNRVYWSDEVYRIFGYEPGGVEVSIKHYFDSIHPDDRKYSRRSFVEAVTERKDLNIEFRICPPAGGERILHGLAEVVYDGQTNKPLKFIGTVQDITERKRIENELRGSEERYRTFVAQSSEAIWRLEINPPCPVDISEDEQIDWLYRCGQLAECNDVTARMYGFESAGQIIGFGFGELLPRADPANVEYLYSFIGAGYKLDNSESRETGKNGMERVFSNSLTGIAENGLVKRIWGTQRDITEQREAEKAIRVQAHLLDTVEQAVIATDLQGNVVYWSRFAEKLFGWTSEEAVGASVMSLTTPDISIEEGKAIMSRLAVGISWSGEFTVKTKENETFPVLITNTPVYDEKGTLVGIVGVSKDITEQKRAETALIEANERAIREYTSLLQRLAKLGETVGVARDLNAVFSAVLEFTRASAPCAALIISLYEEKSKSRKVVYCWHNGDVMDASEIRDVPVGEGIAGKAIETGEVVIGNDYLQHIRERGVSVSFGFEKDAREPQSSIIAPMKIKGGSIGVLEVQSYDKDAYGDEHTTAMSMAANFIANAIENVRLLELERQREEQLRQSQKLESVGRLAGGIAHDFNNMLTAINGYSSLTLRSLKTDDPLRRNIEEIKKAGDRSAALTHQLLAFSRQQVLKPEILDINRTVNDISFMLKRLIGEDVHLISALSSELGQVKVDPGQLSQVIMNLAVNARDAMPLGGVLTIETRNVYLDEEFAARHLPTQAGHYVMLAVSDTGTGIAPETRENIFEPFFTTKEVGKGTGLGLSTVYGIVKQSGGYIWVYSELEKGSTFKIYLPRVGNRPESKKQSELEELTLGTETILLAEDEPMVRKLTRQVLEDCGYTVVEAGNGVEALEICGTIGCRIDLLMTDVVMPRMGGRELAENLSAKLPQMRVLFTSGYTDDAVVRHGVIEIGTNFIQKPFSPTALASKVRQILDADK